jgi:hypothetical protein
MSSFARWPKLWVKSSKGAGEKSSSPEDLVAEFARLWPKMAEKGPEKI